MPEDLRQQLRELGNRLNNLRGYFDVEKKETRISALEKEMSSSGFWDNSQKSASMVKELKEIKEVAELWRGYWRRYEELKELVGVTDLNDVKLNQEIGLNINSLREDLAETEFKAVLSGEFDKNNAILSINAGAGGTESCDWVGMLLRMYTRWAENKNFKVQILDILSGEEAGIKNVTVRILGNYAYGYLKSEIGVHRLVRISPFDANKRRHTSFASVDVIPEIEEDIEIEIKPDEIRMDTYRASGAGGQHVNVTDSAVRITHLPTGIVVQCQNERSQYQNRQVAMMILKARLYEKMRQEKEARASDKHSKKKKIEWGSQIRSYVLHPYNMVKDHRTDYETGNTQAVLDGELDSFMEAYLKTQKPRTKT
ncbi:MAG: peptide chain release factor 2 [Candidatus Omnitrophota bacterium]